MTGYAELQVTANFSFLRGAPHPEEMVHTAAALGLAAVAVTDRNTLAGVVRAHVAAREIGMRQARSRRCALAPLPAARPDRLWPARAALDRRPPPRAQGKLRDRPGRPARPCDRPDPDRPAAARPGRVDRSGFQGPAVSLRRRIGPAMHLAASHLYRGDDRARIDFLAALAGRGDTPLVATNDIHAHVPERRGWPTF